jgi:hypothetical protein
MAAINAGRFGIERRGGQWGGEAIRWGGSRAVGALAQGGERKVAGRPGRRRGREIGAAALGRLGEEEDRAGPACR